MIINKNSAVLYGAIFISVDLGNYYCLYRWKYFVKNLALSTGRSKLLTCRRALVIIKAFHLQMAGKVQKLRYLPAMALSHATDLAEDWILHP